MSIIVIWLITLIAVLLAQTVPGPTDLVTLQWIIITVLAGAVAYLFRLLRKEEKRNSNAEIALVERVFEGLGETNDTIRGLADGVEAIRSQFSILNEIKQLRVEINDRSKGNA